MQKAGIEGQANEGERRANFVEFVVSLFATQFQLRTGERWCITGNSAEAYRARLG